MILTIVKCEMCDHQFSIPVYSRPSDRDVPEDWLTLVEGNPQNKEGWHFCSDGCLQCWLGKRATKDWPHLNTEQVRLLQAVRDEDFAYMRASAELFEKEHPDLRLTWSMTLDARLREATS